ncbi:MAG: MFS transporter, partial [Desulfatibacillaceae bacterium]|nr:MFS transporter [Desulfatibacillaceae bacterium]
MLFLFAFWLYNDGISTIIKMATAYGSEIGIGVGHMAGALVITQFVGIVCTLLFGRAANVFGAKPCVLAGLGVYAIICILGYWMRVPWHFFLLAAAVGTVQGGCQALSRSIFAVMTPRHRAAEFFGFFSASAKMAGIFGPLVFGVVAQATGQARFSIVALVFFFIAGGLLLSRVDVKAGEKAARDAEEQEGAWSA